MFLQHLAFVFACPHLYCEAIKVYNQANLQAPFVSLIWTEPALGIPHFADLQATNLGDDDVLQVLLHNKSHWSGWTMPILLVWSI